jgi:GNAT superfamily N-acetyltransferase
MNNELPEGCIIRHSLPGDHPRIIGVLKEWWGGRDLTWMLPRLFLIHFCDTSLIVEKDEELIAFLIGFLSQTHPNEGYIHFAGVHPDFRGIGLGRFLYGRFYRICRSHQRDTVRACTSPVNKGSIAFHRQIGFSILSGNDEVEGIPVTLDYNKKGDAKVLFEKKI